jgi:hypothetical protein
VWNNGDPAAAGAGLYYGVAGRVSLLNEFVPLAHDPVSACVVHVDVTKERRATANVENLRRGGLIVGPQEKLGRIIRRHGNPIRNAIARREHERLSEFGECLFGTIGAGQGPVTFWFRVVKIDD